MLTQLCGAPPIPGRISVKELPAGDFDVVVITQAGERRCKVGAKDRARLFPAK
jgi:hypothetical protein